MEAGHRADNYCQAHGIKMDDSTSGKKPCFNRGNCRSTFQTNFRPSYQPGPPKFNHIKPFYNYDSRATTSRNWQSGTPYYKKDNDFGGQDPIKYLGCGEKAHRKWQCQKGNRKQVGAVAVGRIQLSFWKKLPQSCLR